MTKLIEKTVDLETYDMVYGRTIFEDGKVVPYCKPTKNFRAGLRVSWTETGWKWIPKT